MITNNEKPRPLFYLGWIVLNFIAVIMAWYTAWMFMSQITKIIGSTIQVHGKSHITEDFLLLYLLFPLIGFLAGIFQYALLRRYLPQMTWWIAATFLGWLMPFITGSLITTFLERRNDTISIMFGMLLMGASISLPQWWILHKRVRHAFWWIIAYGIGWGATGLLNLVTSEPFPVLSAIALMPSITTGIACWLLLDWLPIHEWKNNVSTNT